MASNMDLIFTKFREKIMKEFHVDDYRKTKQMHRWHKGKNGWIYYKNSIPDKSDIIEIIEKIANDCKIPKWSYKQPVHESERFEINYRALNNDQNKEPYVERYITAQNGKRMCNQWCVGKPKESVDLVYLDEDDKYILIELKLNESNYTPPFALVEIIKNYYLAKKFRIKALGLNELPIKKLALLSTKNFYKKYYDYSKRNNFDNINEFYKTIEILKNKYKIDFCLYCLDIDETKLINKIKDKENCSKVKFKKWVELKNLKDWDKLCD